ncbi:MAG: hypothetical protein P794_03990 [Epsilonproteobacteria bacterium (ex Lamellibrachia satsuma)]|nr:MAG: hypothetical protein P794_03990 [Epsilonproteobacteria bacterium (ex Lamellibrachia satsuma)]
MEIAEYFITIKNIELYFILGLSIFTVWFISNTIKYYHGEKRKVKNLHRFAKEGEIDAQGRLAHHYRKGKMVKKNCKKAAFWYQKAAFSGDDEARGYLQNFFDEHKKNKC